MVGGILVFLGALVYLYVIWTWYAGTTTATPASWWLGNYAEIWYPFVAAFAVFSAISLFFMGIGGIAGKWGSDMMNNVLWKFIMIGAVTLLILTAGSAWFLWVVVGLVLTYLGGMLGTTKM